MNLAIFVSFVLHYVYLFAGSFAFVLLQATFARSDLIHDKLCFFVIDIVSVPIAVFLVGQRTRPSDYL